MKSRERLAVLLVASTLLGVAGTAHAMRCGGRLLDKGLTRAEVRKMCGEPTCIRRPGKIFTEKGGIFWPMATDEEWVYNRGPRQFLRLIKFYQGKVVHWETGGYGWIGERDCADIPDSD